MSLWTKVLHKLAKKGSAKQSEAYGGINSYRWRALPRAWLIIHLLTHSRSRGGRVALLRHDAKASLYAHTQTKVYILSSSGRRRVKGRHTIIKDAFMTQPGC